MAQCHRARSISLLTGMKSPAQGAGDDGGANLADKFNRIPGAKCTGGTSANANRDRGGLFELVLLSIQVRDSIINLIDREMSVGQCTSHRLNHAFGSERL